MKFYFNPDKKDLDNFIQTIKKFGNVKNNIINLEIHSQILKNKEELFIFSQLISSRIKINNIILLYRATKDGLEFKNIINKINNKSNLIFLFFTGNKRIFGSYIKTKLENIQHLKYFKDENAFVFSLDNYQIYKILIPEKSIRFYSGYPILIGNDGNGNGFHSHNNIIKDEGLLNNPKIYDFKKNNELTEGLNQLTELEIFEI